MRSQFKLVTFAVALSLFGLVACEQQSANENAENVEKKLEEKEKESPAIPVEVAHVFQGDINATYSNTTSLEAEEEAVVVAKSSEIITEILVEEGDLVTKGQVLARLNTEKLRLELAQAEANLKRLQAELERNKRIYEKKMVSSDVYERLKFDYEAQQAAFELAKLQLQYGTITAPIAGVISERMIKVGNMVKLNEPMFRISDFDPLLAVIHVPETELSKIKSNQPAQIKVDANQQQVFNGRVLRISPIVDSTSGTFKVTVEVTDPNATLRAGMFGRVNVVYANHKDTLLVDKSALLAEEDSPTVFKIVDGKAKKQTIKTGFQNGPLVEVLSGLSIGDQVVIAGQNSLKNASKVSVINEGNTATEVAKLSEK